MQGAYDLTLNHTNPENSCISNRRAEYLNKLDRFYFNSHFYLNPKNNDKICIVGRHSISVIDRYTGRLESQEEKVAYLPILKGIFESYFEELRRQIDQNLFIGGH
jgi:hypothetical protein